MSLSAHYLLILLALFIEFVVTSAAPWRTRRWSSDWLAFAQRLFASMGWWRGWPALAVLIAVPVAAVALVQTLLGDLSVLLAQAFALGVLLLTLGPEDLAGEVAAHQRMLAAEHASEAAASMPAYLRHALPVTLGPLRGDPEFDANRAEVAQIALAAEHAWFQPLFWFLLLGAPGVVLYRLLANLRRSHREEDGLDGPLTTLLELLECVPARLSVLTFGVAGTLVPVLEEIRAVGLTRWRASSSIVARGALAATDHGRIREVISGDARVYRVNQMHGLMRRALVAWVIVIAGVAVGL
ncbi:MAG: hypothetical protein RLW61_04285 [Gammaproteobacteria bacterium]